MTAFDGARILITGGLGFIGSSLAIRLVGAGARVTVVDAMIPDYGGNLFNIEPVKDRVAVNFGDICDRHAMDWLVRGQDFVFHLAGQVSHIKSMTDPFPDIEYNIKGTAVLMEALRLHNSKARVIFTGTRGQYGSTVHCPVNELAATNPKGIYEISNLSAEKIIQVYNQVHGIPAVLLRLTNIYGPRAQMKHSHYGVANWFVRMALDKSPIRVFGTGRALRDFLYIDDCIDAMLLTAISEKADGEIFNVGVDSPTNFLDLAELLTRVCEGATWEYAPFTPERKAQEPGDFYSDITKIRTLVGWAPTTSLEEGMKRTLDFYRMHRDKYWTPVAPVPVAAPVIAVIESVAAPKPAPPAISSSVRSAVEVDHRRFKDLTFDGFRELAKAEGLSRYQKIGFPDSYRAGYEPAIFADIVAKLPMLEADGKIVLDLGAGCSELPHLLLDLGSHRGHTTLLCDSAEMLTQLPDGPGVHKIAGRYPAESAAALEPYAGRVDAILCYSVLHYIFPEQPLFDFLDRLLELLAPGGACLLGDIPNVSMRKRFFASDAGAKSHFEYTGSTEKPDVTFNNPEPGKLDDAVVLAILARCRAAGFHAYVLPQAKALPMANRREDILIERP